MMASPGAGAVGDLSGKSLEELLEILQRQEKLLSNQKFIARLPDRGKKIQDYKEKVQAAIAQHKRLNETTSLLSAFRLEFQERSTNVTERSRVPAAPLPALTQQNEGAGRSASTDEDTAAAIHDGGLKASVEPESPPLSLDNSHGAESLPLSVTVSKKGNNPNVGADGLSGIEDRQPLRDGAALTDDLVNGLKMISIQDRGGNRSDTSETSLEDKVTLNPDAKKSHFIEVVEQRARNPKHRKEKFLPNRLPSDSNSSTPNQSPGEQALRMSAEERRARDRKHLDDITAATMPPLHHSPAQLLPLEQSLSLQMEQQKSYEEQQAKLAAQKLFEKLNIKMRPYNPEGDSYMKYRDQNDDGGFGAEE